MSIAAYSISDFAIAAQVPSQPAIKKPPPKRLVIAIADTAQTPEPR